MNLFNREKEIECCIMCNATKPIEVYDHCKICRFFKMEAHFRSRDGDQSGQNIINAKESDIISENEYIKLRDKWLEDYKKKVREKLGLK